MKRKKAHKTSMNRKKISNNKLMFLSIMVLFILFEALYIMKGQQQLAQRKVIKQVAGVQTQR